MSKKTTIRSCDTCKFYKEPQSGEHCSDCAGNDLTSNGLTSNDNWRPMIDDLIPCPFCGERNTDERFIPHKDDCYLLLRWMNRGNRATLTKAWNTRPGEDALRKRVAESEKESHEYHDINIMLEKVITKTIKQFSKTLQQVSDMMDELDEAICYPTPSLEASDENK